MVVCGRKQQDGPLPWCVSCDINCQYLGYSGVPAYTCLAGYLMEYMERQTTHTTLNEIDTRVLDIVHSCDIDGEDPINALSRIFLPGKIGGYLAGLMQNGLLNGMSLTKSGQEKLGLDAQVVMHSNPTNDSKNSAM